MKIRWLVHVFAESFKKRFFLLEKVIDSLSCNLKWKQLVKNWIKKTWNRLDNFLLFLSKCFS